MDFQLLNEKGWMERNSNPFREKVAAGANCFWLYGTAHPLGLAFFIEKKQLLLRIANSSQNDFRWLQIVAGDKLNDVVIKLTELQDKITLTDYFTIYLTLSELCTTSILAWEQFE